MPELSRFLGVIIRMRPEWGARHHTPHIHARYQEHEASYSITEPIQCLAGSLPRRQHRLVMAWIKNHQAQLLDNWQRQISGRLPRKIPPPS